MVEHDILNPTPLDRFGITEVFAVHLDLSLANMHPEQAFEAAAAATRAYLKSYRFIDVSTKGEGGAQYRMVRKREAGGDTVK